MDTAVTVYENDPRLLFGDKKLPMGRWTVYLDAGLRNKIKSQQQLSRDEETQIKAAQAVWHKHISRILKVVSSVIDLIYEEGKKQNGKPQSKSAYQIFHFFDLNKIGAIAHMFPTFLEKTLIRLPWLHRKAGEQQGLLAHTRRWDICLQFFLKWKVDGRYSDETNIRVCEALVSLLRIYLFFGITSPDTHTIIPTVRTMHAQMKAKDQFKRCRALESVIKAVYEHNAEARNTRILCIRLHCKLRVARDLTDREIEAIVDVPLEPDEEMDIEEREAKRRRIVLPENVNDDPEVEDGLCCPICWVRGTTAAILECGHKCLCVTCAVDSTPIVCPVCKGPVTRIVRIYEQGVTS